MTFSTLALIAAVALLGPLLALPTRWHLPVVLGELVAGIALGQTGTRTLHAGDKTFTLLADVGFALVMFVSGTHVPVRDATLRAALRTGAVRAVAVGVASAIVAFGIATAFGTGHTALYAVLLASSSAALVLPIVDSLSLQGPTVLQTLAQVAIADTVCIVALPLAVDPSHAGRAALGAAAVLASAAVVFLALRETERRGWRRRAHRVSEKRKFAFELRVNLMILFLLGALATRTHVSIMLAGFSFGLAVAGIGAPRRLARQLFAITEGFLGPLFFVWLGASIDVRALAHHPAYIGLGLALGAGAILTHTLMRLLGQPIPFGALAAAQLGVPVAAATIGVQAGVLKPGEPAALILGALVTIAVTALAGGRAVRAQSPAAATPASSREAPGSSREAPGSSREAPGSSREAPAS